MSGQPDSNHGSVDDRQAQRWIDDLRVGNPAEKARARRGLAGVFEARGMHAEAVDLLVANAREGHRDAELFRTLAGLYRLLGDEYLAASAALEASRLSGGHPHADRPPADDRGAASDSEHDAAVSDAGWVPAVDRDRGAAFDARAGTDDDDETVGARSGPDTPGRASGARSGQDGRRASSAWRWPLRIVGWLTVAGLMIGAAATSGRSPASAVLYMLSALMLAVLLSRSRWLRGFIFIPDGPLGDGALLFAWLLTLLAAGALLPRTSSPDPATAPAADATATAVTAPASASPTAVRPAASPSPVGSLRFIRSPAPGSVASPTAAPGLAPGTPPTDSVGAASLALGTATAATQPSMPPAATLAPSHASLIVIRAGQDGVRLRESPGGDELKMLANGARLEWLGQDRQVDGRTWRYVRDPDGTEGWVATDFLTAEHVLSPDASAMGTPTRTIFPPSSVGSAAAKPSTDGTGRAAPRGTLCPATHPIKGNDSASGERIYHLPTGAFYGRTNPEACFATEADARAAGYRASQR